MNQVPHYGLTYVKRHYEIYSLVRLDAGDSCILGVQVYLLMSPQLLKNALRLFQFIEYWPAETHLSHKTRSRDQRNIDIFYCWFKNCVFLCWRNRQGSSGGSHFIQKRTTSREVTGCLVICQAGTERRQRQLGGQRHSQALLIPEMRQSTHDQQRTGENYIVKHFVIYILRLILMGLVEHQRRTVFLVENYVRWLVLSPIKDPADPHTTCIVGPGSMTLAMITFQNYQPNSTFWSLCVP